VNEFDAFVRSHATSLQASAWLLCGDVDDARDLVQSALLVLYRRWDGLRDENLRGYVVTVMANEYRRALGRRARVRDAEWRTAGPDVVPPIDRVSDRDQLLRWLDTIGPGQRMAVVLRVVEDLPEARVAEVLRCSTGTVKSQTSRALAALRERHAADLAQEGLT
jgi:RNA polymerase sigma-70 factor (sigma-E family)